MDIPECEKVKYYFVIIMCFHTAISKFKGRYLYYTCSGKHLLHTWALFPTRANDLEHCVADAVRMVLGNPSNTARLLQNLQAEQDAMQSGAAMRLQAIW